MLKKSLVTALIILLSLAGTAFAAHPMITDDTGTQGKGKSQLEVNGEYGIDREEGVTEKSLDVPTIPFLSYGLNDTMDIVFGLHHSTVTVEDSGAGTTDTVRGIMDASLELKARFYEKDGLSLAVKPGISLPTGNEEKGLGNGKTSYRAFFIATREAAPWAFHFNVGYVRNEYKLQADEDANRRDIWHVSLASHVEVAKRLKVVSNVGMQRNRDKTSEIHPAFILGGFIYSVTENIDVDAGIKYGLNKPETDMAYLAGITWRL